MVFSTVAMGGCLTVANVLLVQINVLINNCVASNITGSANGIALTATMIGRVTGPVILGRLYSWSLTNVNGVGRENALGFPFDDYFIFFVVSLLCVFAAVVARYCLSDDFPIKTRTRISYLISLEHDILHRCIYFSNYTRRIFEVVPILPLVTSGILFLVRWFDFKHYTNVTWKFHDFHDF